MVDGRERRQRGVGGPRAPQPTADRGRRVAPRPGREQRPQRAVVERRVEVADHQPGRSPERRRARELGDLARPSPGVVAEHRRRRVRDDDVDRPARREDPGRDLREDARPQHQPGGRERVTGDERGAARAPSRRRLRERQLRPQARGRETLLGLRGDLLQAQDVDTAVAGQRHHRRRVGPPELQVDRRHDHRRAPRAGGDDRVAVVEGPRHDDRPEHHGRGERHHPGRPATPDEREHRDHERDHRDHRRPGQQREGDRRTGRPPPPERHPQRDEHRTEQEDAVEEAGHA